MEFYIIAMHYFQSILFYNKIHLQKKIMHFFYLISIMYILVFYEVRQCFVSVTSGVIIC